MDELGSMSGWDDEERLEHRFTFPPAASPTRDDFVFVIDESKRPLVVLLGWAGCQDKYLAKYSAIYEQRSCITLRCTAPVECLFWRRDRLPRISRRLIELIEEKCSDENPVFFHIFSNGGAIFYQHISSAMQQAGSPLKVKGVIFDSSPGERRLTSLYGAISAIIGGHPLTNVPISLVVTFFLSFIWLIEILAHSIGKANTLNTDPIALAEEPYSWPQIFLYSNADTLIQYGDVERFASRRADRGVKTQLVLFTDSPHVKHYATYRDVYVRTVCGFINDCLTDEERDDEKDSLLYLTKRIVPPTDASMSNRKRSIVSKLAYEADSGIGSRKSTIKSKKSRIPGKLHDSIENYKRINALTVFVKQDDDTYKVPEEEPKVIKEKIKKRRISSSAVNSRLSKKITEEKDNAKPKTIKMTTFAKLSVSSPTCSKNHQLREKMSYEKRIKNQKKPEVKKIPATQKYFYTFGEVRSDLIGDKEKRHDIVDGFKKSSSYETKYKKLKPNYMKPKESNAATKDAQLSEIEIQLKNIQSQKKKINHLIFKELRDTKTNWQELRSKTSMINVRNLLNSNDDGHVKKLCETLEETSQQVAQLHRTFTDIGNLKSSRSNKSKRIEMKERDLKSAHGRGDTGENTSLENYIDERTFTFGYGHEDSKSCPSTAMNASWVTQVNKDFEKRQSSINQNHNGPMEKMHSDSETATNLFSYLSISESPRKDLFSKNQEFNGLQDKLDSLLDENKKKWGIHDLKDTQIMKQCSDVSCQSGANVTINSKNSYPILSTKLPGVLRSEFLKKSCCFDK